MLGNGRMVGGVYGDVEYLGDSQSAQTDRSRRGGMNKGDAVFVAVVEHFQQRRTMQRNFRIFGHHVGACRLEVDDIFRCIILDLQPAGLHQQD